jgi:fatty-acyl-CoA synthase
MSGERHILSGSQLSATGSGSPWLPGWEPRAGRLARARLRIREDISAIERYRPEDLRPGATLLDCLRAAAALDPDKAAMIALRSADPSDAPRVVTYRELIGSITRAANLFHELAGGERPSVAIVLPMIPEGLIAAYAAATCGIATPINPFLELHHVAGILAASAVNILVTTDDEIWAKLATIRDEVPTLRHILLVNASDAANDFETAARRYPADRLTFTPAARADSVAIHMPTGGTTASPKLAKLTHGGQLTVAWVVGTLMGAAPDGVVGHAMPNFHVGGAVTLGLRTLLYGQTLLTLTRDGFRNRGVIANFWHIARHYRMTSVLSTPATAAALLAERDANAEGHFVTDFHCGGSTVPLALMHGFHDRFGVWLRENWGMTELHGTMSGHPNDGQQPVIGSVGCTLPFFRAKSIIVDEDNVFQRECAPGERGVLALGGPTVMPGYVDQRLDAAYFVRGMPDGERWGNTGDVGALDERGYVWLFGRSKEVIIRGGHNIDPKPVEEVLVRFPGVQLAAMVGKPDGAKGELPVAYIQPKEGATIDSAELLAFCAQHAHERAALPVELIMIDQMPLTAVGKISKPVLNVDILRRTVEAVVSGTVTVPGAFETSIDMSGRRPKVKIGFAPGGAVGAEALERLRKALSVFEFESEVAGGTA